MVDHLTLLGVLVVHLSIFGVGLIVAVSLALQKEAP